jgi:hypothetical protein
MFSALVEKLQELSLELGGKVAVESTNIKAYDNGFCKSPADIDAR